MNFSDYISKRIMTHLNNKKQTEKHTKCNTQQSPWLASLPCQPPLQSRNLKLRSINLRKMLAHLSLMSHKCILTWVTWLLLALSVMISMLESPLLSKHPRPQLKTLLLHRWQEWCLTSSATWTAWFDNCTMQPRQSFTETQDALALLQRCNPTIWKKI